jgi:glycosyltransferase involved in cell wall biosynthesis
LPFEFDVTFVGQAYGDRPAYIKFLLDQGIDVRVWGWGWRKFSSEAKASGQPGLLRQVLRAGQLLMTKSGRQALRQYLSRKLQVNLMGALSYASLPSSIRGGVLSDLELVQMFSRSKINLGFSSCGSTHETGERILQVRLRDFEVPMSGGFYMVEYMEELEEFFDIGKEIICYTDKEDLAEKIKYYLKHDDERERIREAGYERCLRDHTWHKRFQKAFREMGLA